MKNLANILSVLLDKNNKLAIVLGAGASRYSGMPVTNEWLPFVFSSSSDGNKEFLEEFLRDYSVNLIKEHYKVSDSIRKGLIAIKELTERKEIFDRAIEILENYILPAKGDRLGIEDENHKKFEEINEVFGNALAICYSMIGEILKKDDSLSKEIQNLLSLLFNIEELVSGAEVAMAQIKTRERENRHIPNIALAALFKNFSCWYREMTSVTKFWNSVYKIIYYTLLEAGKSPSEPYLCLAQFIKENRNRVSILTFNYDTLLEQALSKLEVGCNFEIIETKKCVISSILLEKKGVPILKLHGSQWWWRGKEDSEIIYNETKIDDLKTKTDWSDALIIGPSAMKHFEDIDIIRLWAKGYEALRDADVVLVIGYSFPNIDEQAINMMRKGIRNNGKKVIIVDIYPNKTRLEEIIPSCQILEGPAEDIIPRLLL
jgi:NAD-dependent SIR2 family protein deacetylase